MAVASASGLVIGSREPVATANWLSLPKLRGVALVGWSHADDDSEATVADLIDSDRLAWQPLSDKIALPSGDIVLFHAASLGAEVREVDPCDGPPATIGDAIPFTLKRGRYVLECAVAGGVLDRDPFSCVICRWVPIASAA